MSNKSNGTAFEKDWAYTLSKIGYWAHCVKDNANGQPFDVIAAKGGRVFAFDCKACKDKFLLSRVEDNQYFAMKKFIECGNANAYFVLKFGVNTYLIHFADIIDLRQNHISSISEDDARRLDQWSVL